MGSSGWQHGLPGISEAFMERLVLRFRDHTCAWGRRCFGQHMQEPWEGCGDSASDARLGKGPCGVQSSKFHSLRSFYIPASPPQGPLFLSDFVVFDEEGVSWISCHPSWRRPFLWPQCLSLSSGLAGSSLALGAQLRCFLLESPSLTTPPQGVHPCFPSA